LIADAKQVKTSPGQQQQHHLRKQDANNGDRMILQINLCSGLHTAFRLISFFELIDA
jgi:hypothetical protein